VRESELLSAISRYISCRGHRTASRAMISRRFPLSTGDGPRRGTLTQRSSTPSARPSRTGRAWMRRSVITESSRPYLPNHWRRESRCQWSSLLGLDDPIVEPSAYQCAARMFDNAYIVEEVRGGHFIHR